MAIFYDANVNPPRPASGHEYKNAIPWLNDETQFACEGCGDLVTLEKAKLRDQRAAIDRMSIFKCAALGAPLIPQNERS